MRERPILFSRADGPRDSRRQEDVRCTASQIAYCDTEDSAQALVESIRLRVAVLNNTRRRFQRAEFGKQRVVPMKAGKR